MKILLLNPTGPKVGMDHFLKAPPLGLMILAATVPEHKVEILDLRNYDYSPEFVERKIQKFDLIGVTASTSMINGALKLCRIAKENDVKTLIGGYHGSLVPETALYPEVDVVVRGEGEITFPELISSFNNGQSLKSIKGISFKNGSELYQTENRPLINLDDSPFPRRDLIRKYDYHYFWASIDALESARGCPHQCHFVVSPLIGAAVGELNHLSELLRNFSIWIHQSSGLSLMIANLRLICAELRSYAIS